MDFPEIFQSFLAHKKDLKVISVASCDLKGKPNGAAKMLIDIVEPHRIYFMDYRYTQTFANLKANSQVSVSFMDDASFTGYRLNGGAQILESGKEYEEVKQSWDKRVIAYEADRIVRRMTGRYSTKESENKLPKDFVIVKMTVCEGAVIKPDRVFKATS